MSPVEVLLLLKICGVNPSCKVISTARAAIALTIAAPITVDVGPVFSGICE